MPTGIYVRTAEYRDKMRRIAIERKYGYWTKGKPKSPNAYSYPKGRQHPKWRGGTTSVTRKTRSSKAYKMWRRTIFIRDDFTCQECGLRNVYLQVHHIKPASKYPELVFENNNGKTLCVDCHKKTDTYCGKGRWLR